MKQTKLLALFLCLLLAVCPVLVACQSDSPEESSAVSGSRSEGTSSGSDDSIYTDENGNYTLNGVNMPEFNFTETEFRVCVYNNTIQTTYFSEEIGYDMYDTTDTVLNEAVKTRNDLVEQSYGVKVTACAVDNVLASVQQDVTSQTNLYDAAMPFMKDCATLAQDGMLYNLKDYAEFIHLEAPWWDQVANEALSISNKLYFTTGDISIMQKIVSTAVLFNRSMYNEICYDTWGDLYELVRNYRWTLDTMYEMGKLATRETDGQTGMTINDTWGIAGTDGMLGFYFGSGNALISKDAQDLPVLALDNEASLTYAQKVLEIFSQSDEWFFNTSRLQGQVTNIWEEAMAVFGEERALFYNCAFSAIKKLRNYSVANDFGIVPLPLGSETQDKYYTQASAAYAYGICIPKGVPNAEFSAYMIEVLACGGKNYITPAYYEVTLKVRGGNDADSEEMLDSYIFNNVVYDLGVIYDFGKVSSMFGTLMAANSTDIVSTLDSNKDAINAAIQSYVDAYDMDS